jgi:hypothetical protein
MHAQVATGRIPNDVGRLQVPDGFLVLLHGFAKFFLLIQIVTVLAVDIHHRLVVVLPTGGETDRQFEEFAPEHNREIGVVVLLTKAVELRGYTSIDGRNAPQ